MRAIPECIRGMIMTRRYTNPHLPLSLPYTNLIQVRCACYFYVLNTCENESETKNGQSCASCLTTFHQWPRLYWTDFLQHPRYSGEVMNLSWACGGLSRVVSYSVYIRTTQHELLQLVANTTTHLLVSRWSRSL